MQVQAVTPSSFNAADPIDHNIDWKEAMNTIIYRLTAIHRRIDDEIRSELKRRAPSWLRLLRLKKLRLAVKDRLHNLRPAGRLRLKPGRV